MEPKYKPVTPLPWTNDDKTGGTRLMRGGQDAIYARHAANAYPKLVEALAEFIDASDQFVEDTGLKHGDLITDKAESARAILRELGEYA
jgi:hypothetical protein